MTTFQTFPSEILLEIGEKATLGTLASLRTVNRRFYDLFTPSLFKWGTLLASELEDCRDNPVSWAITRNRIDLVTIFLSYGLPINKHVVRWEDHPCHWFKVSFLHLACTSHVARGTGDTTMAKLLIDHGAEINCWYTVAGTSLLRHVVEEGRKGQRSTILWVNLLLDHGAEIDCRTQINGFTNMMIAVGSNNPEALVVLLDRGADLNATGEWGQTALRISVENGMEECEKILREQYGATYMGYHEY